jgi:hypothetical protein
MNFRIIFLSCLAALAVFLGVEAPAAACVTNAACSGTRPTCDLITFECRACASDVDCGAPLSGDVCNLESGACMSASGGSQTCSIDSDCDTLGGYVCSGAACILGCHFTLFGDTCIFGTQCVIGFGLSIGTCEPSGGSSSGAGSSGGGASSGGASSGGASSGGASSGGGTSSGGTSSGGTSSGGTSSGGTSSGGASSGGASSGGASSGGASSGGASSGGGDASTSGCTSDADCGLSSGEVCDIGPNGSACVPGCHDTSAGDTCPSPTTCSVTGGGLGVCLASGDAGPFVCNQDSDCGAPGLVCDGGTCVVGCHDTTGAGDTCPAGAQCSVIGGGLGVCVAAGTDAGVMMCTSDSDCLPGLVCVAGECANGCHATSSGDTCTGGAHCNVLDGGIGDCVGGTSPGSTCTVDSDCNGGLVCEGTLCVVGCDVSSEGDSGAPVDSCLVGGTCSSADGGIGQCVGSDAGITPACTTDSDCISGLVCDSSACVVGCHSTAAGDTCPGGSACSVTGGGLGVCVVEGSDGGAVACAADADCPSGDVCDDGVCVTGCQVVGGVDSCASPSSCDAVNGSLGVCTGGGDGGGPGDAAIASDASGDATTGLHGDGGEAYSPVVEGGGCGCVLAPARGAEGASLFFLLVALVMVARKRGRSGSRSPEPR